MRVLLSLSIASVFLFFLFSGNKHSQHPSHENKYNNHAKGTFTNTSYEVCFLPRPKKDISTTNCFDLIEKHILQAQKSIHVMGYSFTSRRLGEALITKYKQGVEVQVILDKSQFGKEAKKSQAIFFHSVGIPLYNDKKPSISHNKVMIFDLSTVLTGSSNFSGAAESHNSENIIIIADEKLAKQYLGFWEERKKVSEKPEFSETHFPDKHRN